MSYAQSLCHKTKWILILSLIVVVVSALYPSRIFASSMGGSGDGSGGGGGAGVSLYMDWSYPANGERNVSITPIIQCKYSHNVAQHTVIKRNESKFSLSTADGKEVKIRVYAADVQIEFDKRQYIYIEPSAPLSYDTTYKVVADAGMQSKNGMATEEAQSFSFTTCSEREYFNASSVESMIPFVQENDEPKDGEGVTSNQNGTDEVSAELNETSSIPKSNEEAVDETADDADVISYEESIQFESITSKTEEGSENLNISEDAENINPEVEMSNNNVDVLTWSSISQLIACIVLFVSIILTTLASVFYLKRKNSLPYGGGDSR